MLYLDIAGVLNAFEIQNHYTFLCKNGFSPFLVSRLLNQKTKSISNANLEKLCLLLHCTPNDLYVWSGTKTMQNNSDHPLSKLIPIRRKLPIMETIRKLPLQKVIEMRNSFDETIRNMK